MPCIQNGIMWGSFSIYYHRILALIPNFSAFSQPGYKYDIGDCISHFTLAGDFNLLQWVTRWQSDSSWWGSVPLLMDLWQFQLLASREVFHHNIMRRDKLSIIIGYPLSLHPCVALPSSPILSVGSGVLIVFISSSSQSLHPWWRHISMPSSRRPSKFSRRYGWSSCYENEHLQWTPFWFSWSFTL